MASDITRKAYNYAIAREGQEGTTVDRGDNNVQIVTQLEGSSLKVQARVEGKWVERVSAEIAFEGESIRADVLRVLDDVCALDKSGSTRALLLTIVPALQPSAVCVSEDSIQGVQFDFEFTGGSKGNRTNLFGHSIGKPQLYPAVEEIFKSLLKN